MIKRIAILGSTGSIGTNCLDVISRLGRGLKVVCLSADSNFKLLAAQARKFRPGLVCIGDRSLERPLRELVPSGTRIVSGRSGIEEAASAAGVDIMVMAISGTSCIAPLVCALKYKKRIALANKEALVSAGPIIMRSAKANGVEIIPVDSEHSAIFQCLDGRDSGLSRIYLTASGGPLLGVKSKDFDSISRKKILKHPKWKMGQKITIDSATMMNKGLEIIEAQHLFDLDEGRIEVLIHPEAIIHSMVEFVDGSVLAQLAMPDMRLPIQYALTYPARCPGSIASVDFSKTGTLSFLRPDMKKFPCLGLARAASKAGGSAPAVLCSADEEVVKNYLDGKIQFSDIPKIIEKVLSRHRNIKTGTLSLGDVLNAGEWAKKEVRKICSH